MNKNIKIKLLKYVIFISIVFLIFFILYFVQNDKYNINFVDNNCSLIYKKTPICTYDSKEDLFIYENVDIKINEEIETIFNIYQGYDCNMINKIKSNYIYNLNCFDVVDDNIILYLYDSKNDLDKTLFKMMKLTFNKLGYNKLIIYYNNNIYSI